MNQPDILTAALLGLIQGLTEFLPVSSSGHLVIGQELFGLTEPQLLFDVLLHIGTLTAVVVFVRRELVGLILAFFKFDYLSPGGFKRRWKDDPDFRLLTAVVVGTIPTGIIGLAFKDVFEALFDSSRAVGWAFLATGLMLLASRLARPGERGEGDVGPWRSAVVGLVQGLAIIPGISRSGSTITAGLFLGLTRETAARFSFLLSLPAIVGALILELLDTGGLNVALSAAVAGFLTALVSGYLALVWLVRLVKAGRLHWFAPYLFVIGAITLWTAG